MADGRGWRDAQSPGAPSQTGHATKATDQAPQCCTCLSEIPVRALAQHHTPAGMCPGPAESHSSADRSGFYLLGTSQSSPASVQLCPSPLPSPQAHPSPAQLSPAQPSPAQLASPSLPGTHQARPPWGPRPGLWDTNRTAESTSQRAGGGSMPWRPVGQHRPRERTETAKERKEYSRVLTTENREISLAQ